MEGLKVHSAFLLMVLLASAVHGRRYSSSASSSSSSSSSSSEEGENGASGTLRRGTTSLKKIFQFEVAPLAETLTGQVLVEYVNRKQDLWTARLNEKMASYEEDVKWRLMGVNHIRNSVKARMKLAKSRMLDIDLPTNFDAREQWPNCQSLRQIRDQSSCGSCWAFGAVEAMSDRICIASGGKRQVSLSAADLLSCCTECGFGCDGGEPLAAWNFWVREGIVTGSNYTAQEGCRPYPFPPCEHHSNKTHYPECKHDLYPTPKCEKKCQASYGEQDYKKDKFYGTKAYAVDATEEAIQKELFTNGPLEISFEVYEDFLNYDGGIYIHTGGKLGGGHAVKLIGWGEEGGIPYWTVANSWNTDWGEDGFFRILRGKDECGIESGAVGGIPDLSRSETADVTPIRSRFAHWHPAKPVDY